MEVVLTLLILLIPIGIIFCIAQLLDDKEKAKEMAEKNKRDKEKEAEKLEKIKQLKLIQDELVVKFKKFADFTDEISKVYLNQPKNDSDFIIKPFFMIKNSFEKSINAIRIKIEQFNKFNEVYETTYWTLSKEHLDIFLTIPTIFTISSSKEINTIMTARSINLDLKYLEYVDIENLKEYPKYIITIDKIAFDDGEIVDYSEPRKKVKYDIR